MSRVKLDGRLTLSPTIGNQARHQVNKEIIHMAGYENSRLWLRVRLDMTGTVPPGETAGGYWIIEPHLRPAPVAGVQAQPKSPTRKMVPLDLARVALQVTPPPVEPEEPPESDESAAVVPKALIEPASEPEEVEPEAVNAANPFLSADPVTTTTRTIIYQYDDLYRVTKATYCDGAYTKANPCTTPTHEYVYTYDENGNRKTETITGAGLSSVNNVFNYNDANQLTTATINGTGYTYTYDNNGNLTNDGTTTYTYDAADRLITLANGTNTYTYTYNGLGDRLSQAVTGGSTTQYLLDLNANLTQVLSEYTQGATTPDVNYLHGHDIIGQQRGTTWHYFGYDGLGSNRFMMNSAGALTYSALYDPYGQVLSAVGTGNTNLGFTGEHTDPTGLQYLRARYYDPRTATFLSRDPAIGAYPTLSGSWNGYTYAHGNPVMYTDPYGLSPCPHSGLEAYFCQQAFDTIEGGFRHLSNFFRGDPETVTLAVEATAVEVRKRSDEFYSTTQTHWAGSAGAGTVFEPADWVVTLNNWANGDFFILDLLAFAPIVSAAGIRSVFRQGDGIVRQADDLVVGRLAQSADEGMPRVPRGSGGEPFAFGTGSRNERAQVLLNEAAAASNVSDLSKYVDKVIYDPTKKYPYFRVNRYGTRTIVIDPRTFEKTRAGQLIVGTHELVHAQRFELMRRRFGGSRYRAWQYFFEGSVVDSLGRRMNRVQEEVFAETLALRRVSRYLGGLTPQQVGHSTRYLDYYLRRRSPRPKLP